MAIFEIAKNGTWSKKKFREIDLFDFMWVFLDCNFFLYPTLLEKKTLPQLHILTTTIALKVFSKRMDEQETNRWIQVSKDLLLPETPSGSAVVVLLFLFLRDTEVFQHYLDIF